MQDYFNNKALDVEPVLDKIILTLRSLESRFYSSDIEGSLRDLSEELGISFRKIAEVIRIAIWAKKVSPPLFITMEILGYDLSISRISDYQKIITKT